MGWSALNQYVDSTLKITGAVESISASQLFLSLSGSQGLVVKCYFSQGQESQLANIAMGQNIIVQGICTGKDSMWNPEISDCVLAP
jgi:hypothetical protein